MRVSCLAIPFLFLTSGLALATTKAEKTVFKNGINASGFFELGLSHSSLNVEGSRLRTTLLSSKLGWQLLRFEHISITAGVERTGFKSTLNSDSDYDKQIYDYIAPYGELIIFPNKRLQGKVGVSGGKADFSLSRGELGETLVRYKQTKLGIAGLYRVAKNNFVIGGIDVARSSDYSFKKSAINSTDYYLYGDNTNTTRVAFSLGFRASTM